MMIHLTKRKKKKTRTTFFCPKGNNNYIGTLLKTSWAYHKENSTPAKKTKKIVN